MEYFLQDERPSVSIGTRRLLCGVSLLLLAVLLFPVRDDGVWWLLSRGREAVSGNLSPTAALLSASSRPEADWLSGVIWWAAFEALGASGLMLLKILLAGLMLAAVLRTCVLRQSYATPQAMSVWVIVLLLLMATRDAWDCHSTSLDCVCFAAALALMASAARNSGSRLSLGMFALSCLWANTGQFGLLSVVMLLDGSTCRSPLGDRRLTVKLLAASLIGLCMTPCGPFGLLDMARRMWPFLFETNGWLRGTEMGPLWQQPVAMPVIAFGCLLCGGVMSRGFSLMSDRTWPTWILWGTWGWCVSSLMPVIAVLLAVRWMRAADERLSANLPLAMDVVTARKWAACGRVLVLVAGCGACLGGYERRPGWGLDARLALGPVNEALSDIKAKGSVWCVGRRAEGAIAWLRPAGLKVADSAERAWLEGRFRDYAALNLDLRRGWRDSQRRADGTTAGWWLPLTQQRVELVVGAAEDAELIAALEPTVWKPLLLEGGVIPFAKAGDAGVTPRIMLVLRQREFVERGPWNYSVTDARPDSRCDFGELLGFNRDAEPAWRQARTLRAMNLHGAALRVVDATRSVLADRRLGDEHALSLVAQAHEEWLAKNALSHERLRALREVMDRPLSQAARSMVQHQLRMSAEAVQ